MDRKITSFSVTVWKSSNIAQEGNSNWKLEESIVILERKKELGANEIHQSLVWAVLCYNI